MLFGLALLFLLLALGLWLLARRQYRASGLPRGRLVYVDTGAFGRPERALFDQARRLTGKPDYLVQAGEAIIPVEVKTSRAPDEPYDSHVLQLAAYCLLVESAYGTRPPYGIIKYPQRTFAVDYTPELEATLLATLAALRAGSQAADVPRNHEDPARCRRCGVRHACDQRLT
jgi:CRISPR-associated exonuclease Cas4